MVYHSCFICHIWKLTYTYVHCWSRLTNVDDDGQLYGVSGGSGGYAETVFRHAAHVLFDRKIEGSVDFRILRNSDFREVTLEVNSSCIMLACFQFSLKHDSSGLRLILYNVCCVNAQVEGKPVLKFALCYGFRNLQNIVRKVKMGKCEYHFIEVMACPSGTPIYDTVWLARFK